MFTLLTGSRMLSAAALEAQLRKFRGNQAAAGRALGASRSAVANFLTRHPRLRELTNDLREARVDEAEDQLSRAVARGEGWAVCLILRTIGRHRGYAEGAPAAPGPNLLAALAALAADHEED